MKYYVKKKVGILFVFLITIGLSFGITSVLSNNVNAATDPVNFDQASTGVIQNNTAWLSTDGQPIEARSGSIIQVGDTYHWFGAERNDNNFKAINHYTSTNLAIWKKEAPAIDNTGIFKENNWVGRPWVMYNKKNDNYIMVLEQHLNGKGNRNHYRFLRAKTLSDSWELLSTDISQLFDSKGVKYGLGDLGAYQEGDEAYLLYTFDKNPFDPVDPAQKLNKSQAILKLNADFTDVSYVDRNQGKYEAYKEFNVSKSGEWPREAASIFKRNGVYYYFTSRCEGFKSSGTNYRTATSIMGDWSEQEAVQTANSNTNSYNSQHDFILPITGTKETLYMFAGDRWEGAKSAYQWSPLIFDSKGVPTIDGSEDVWSVTTIANPVLNPSFEDSIGQVISNWNKTADMTGSPYVEKHDLAADLNNQLTFYAKKSEKSNVYQTLPGLANGTYQMTISYKSSGDHVKSYMYVKDYGGEEQQVNLPTTTSWAVISTAVDVTDGKATIGFYVESPTKKWLNIDHVQFTRK
ncbi:hypothetical protein HB943_14405 [Listeria weihenstephanensis]|uniref:Beta-xylosidase n=1 Tax=Listeria weihenstephanensis TaxID=1006155 RepID=A0A841Z9B5_9LIST|nr:hypothetical protein [Listeria weihenstephanensis]MBC1501790.1 hypothetical protein [Listeria weihenstephanensis]